MDWLGAIDKARSSFVRFWAFSLALALTLIAMSIGATSGLERLWERWTDYPYNHAFVIFGMSAWLAIDTIRNARIERLYPSAVGGMALLVAFAFYLAMEEFDWILAMQATLPLMLLAIIAAIAGLNVGSRMAIPILFLYFAIPVWDLMIPPLQQTTIAAVGAALRWTGFTAFIDGTFIHIPAGTFEIADGCAGLRYFIVSATLATFYGLYYLRAWASSLALIVLALASAIFCNWVRVYSLVVIGDITEMQHYLIAVSHARFGWFIYAFSLIPVVVFARVLEGREKVDNPTRLKFDTKLADPPRFLGAAMLASALLITPTFLGS